MGKGVEAMPGITRYRLFCFLATDCALRSVQSEPPVKLLRKGQAPLVENSFLPLVLSDQVAYSLFDEALTYQALELVGDLMK